MILSSYKFNFKRFYFLTLKWLGKFSLLKAKLSTFILVKALKSSGMSITGMEICDNSRTVWLIPHMKTESRGSEARYSFRLGCFTLIFLVLILAMIEAIFPSCSTDKKSAHANKKVTRQLRFPQYFWSFYRSKQLNNSLLTVRSSSGSSPSSPPRQQCATWTTAVQESPRSYSRHVRVVVVGEREPQHDLLLWLQKPTKISHEAYTSVVYSTSDSSSLEDNENNIFHLFCGLWGSIV